MAPSSDSHMRKSEKLSLLLHPLNTTQSSLETIAKGNVKINMNARTFTTEQGAESQVLYSRIIFLPNQVPMVFSILKYFWRHIQYKFNSYTLLTQVSSQERQMLFKQWQQ